MVSVDLQQLFLQYAGKHHLELSGNKVLAAVSGGIDSMVMLHLLHAVGADCAVAHCNFNLRGDESDGDEFFVKEKTAGYGFELHVGSFDTIGYAGEKDLSIQMAARELRYGWFEELSVQHGYDIIAIAHNRDDRIETLFINLARGTGIHGLTGIKPRNGKLIRPLLFASREDIIAYAKINNIVFREDSSNKTDKYVRNYIRHHVIPGLERFFPGMQQTIDRNIEYFSGIEAIYNEALIRFMKEIVHKKNGLVYIDLQALFLSPSPVTLLYEILNPFGFSNAVATDVLNDATYPSGRQFFSDTHRLLYDRKTLVVQMLEKEKPQEYLIDHHISHIDIPICLNIEMFDRYPGFKPDTQRDIACLDFHKLQFPLLLRKWEHGDAFRPLGMTNMKKLSDFFIDQKLSLIEKEQCWVLASAGQIVWIVGLRIDDRFKITDETAAIMRIEWIKEN